MEGQGEVALQPRAAVEAKRQPGLACEGLIQAQDNERQHRCHSLLERCNGDGSMARERRGQGRGSRRTRKKGNRQKLNHEVGAARGDELKGSAHPNNTSQIVGTR